MVDYIYNENQQHTHPSLQKHTCLQKHVKLNTVLCFICISLLIAVEKSKMDFLLAKCWSCLIMYNELYMRVWKGVLALVWFFILHWLNMEIKTPLKEEWVSPSRFYSHKHISYRRSDRWALYLAKLVMSAMSQFKRKITQRQTRGTNTWLLTFDCHFFRLLFKKQPAKPLFLQGPGLFFRRKLLFGFDKQDTSTNNLNSKAIVIGMRLFPRGLKLKCYKRCRMAAKHMSLGLHKASFCTMMEMWKTSWMQIWLFPPSCESLEDFVVYVRGSNFHCSV